jgi:NitT/TauT family transport system permease protein
VLALLGDGGRFPLFRRAVTATVESAAIGFAIGALLGFMLAVLMHVAPRLKPGADRLAAVVNAIPGVALGPILIVTFSREATPAALAATHVFFLVYVATTAGLHAASQTHQDLFSVLGASRLSRLLRLEIPTAVPAVVSGLKLGLAAAMLGAILGEWFGAPRGLGLLIVNAMQNFQIPLLWAAVLLATAISLALFGLATLIERAVYRSFR